MEVGGLGKPMVQTDGDCGQKGIVGMTKDIADAILELDKRNA
jgi:hypothetical protein